MSVNSTHQETFYSGEDIGAITLDEDQSILYIAEKQSSELVAINYNQAWLLAQNKTTPVPESIYKGKTSLKSVTSMAVDFFGNLFWASGTDGKSSGSITEAMVDVQKENSILPISKAFESVYDLKYKNNALLFSASIDGNTSDVGVFYKKHKAGEQPKKQVTQIKGGFLGTTSVDSLDTFVYVASSEQGFFAIEVLGDKEFSEPRAFKLSYEGHTLANPTSLLVISMHALTNLSISLLASLSTLALVFWG